ncbi:pyridoxamine 5'-phosphate oxidase family protein [Desulfomonile tiedjei]|uniref:Pyridoxamine 5''-phosphate oxidase n=1 Tax=Desulfomonile tiedjei (strain ATCC 49306 / DSM 6799 / DCB-1) TaxID=706587 RepID=I4C217_DESTA|nr:pyridoxamine 5'-phosphate oxidase family protein [Desulfomonile tiedjei]AFM23608.1 Pyridoxamine 5''-phosphate oxidase [Desulfomonile tiedjei DSM 6799]
MSKELMEYFNKQPRMATLSTADSKGNVDSAYFGSPRMIDEKTIVMGSGTNRTLANLRENPKAVFLIMEPGKTIAEWKGVRIYVTMKDCATSGQQLDQMRAAIAERVGPEVANKMIHAAITFEIDNIRPLADFGQSWEKSI